MGYTWAQFRTYLRQAAVREAERRAADLVVASHARAGGDAAMQLLRQLHGLADNPD